MYELDYRSGAPDLVVNTSCEHIADVRGWLDLLPAGTRVLLQSNDYFAEPTHINCVASLEEFAGLAGLGDVRFLRRTADEEIHAVHADRAGVGGHPPCRVRKAALRPARAIATT